MKLFLRDLNEKLEMGADYYDLLVPGGHLICTVHRDGWDQGGFGTVLQALAAAGVAEIRSREADRLFADDDEPAGWYVGVEKLPS